MLSAWRIHSRTVSSAKSEGGRMPTGHEQRQGRQQAGGQGGERGDAEDDGHGDPHQREADGDRPGEAGENAEIGGDAFAAAEAEPHRTDMPEEGAEAGDEGRYRAEPGERYQDGRRALQPVAQQGCRGERLVAGSQHVGGADIARADGADIAEAGQPRKDHAEGDGAEEVAENQREERIHAHEIGHETSPRILAGRLGAALLPGNRRCGNREAFNRGPGR